VARGKKRGKHCRPGERRPMPGMLLHIVGKHQWLGEQRWHDLIVILDDAHTGIDYAPLVEEESTRTVVTGLRELVETQGLFCALHSDRAVTSSTRGGGGAKRTAFCRSSRTDRDWIFTLQTGRVVARTTLWPSRTGAGSWIRAASGTHWRARPSPSTSIWTPRYRFSFPFPPPGASGARRQPKAERSFSFWAGKEESLRPPRRP
jgi:hypothetical protein